MGFISGESVESQPTFVKALLGEVEGLVANCTVGFGEWPHTGARKIDRSHTVIASLAAGLFSVTICCVQPVFAQSSVLPDRRSEDIVPTEIGLALRLSPALSKSPFKRGKPSIRSGETDELRLAVVPEIDSRNFSSRKEVFGSPLPPDRRNPPDDPTKPDSMPGPILSERAGGRRSGSTEGAATTVDTVSVDMGVAGEPAWRIPPIRWGGSTGVQATQTSNSDGMRATSLQETIGLRASSYIYQPWMAQVSGNLMLTTGGAKSSSGPQDESQNGTTSLSGGGSLSLFPVSRFPAVVTYDLSNSRNSSEIVSDQYTHSRLGLRQSYRPEDGSYQTSAAFTRSDINAAMQGKSAVNVLQGDFSGRLENHRLQSGASYSTSDHSLTGEGSRLLTLNANHAFQALENVTIHSLASITDNAINYSQGALGMAQSHGRYMQFNSSASWQPEEDDEGEQIPLNVSGGVNAFSALSDTAGVRTDSLSLGANLSASYRYSPNLSLHSNGMLTSVTNAGLGSQMLMMLGAGANYAGDPIQFDKISYTWNVGGNGNLITGGFQGSIQTVSGQFGHSLARPVEIDETSGLYLTLGQNVADTASSQGGNSASISHSAGASYRISRGPSLGGSASLSLSDTMTVGANVGHFASLNLNLSGQAQFNSRSSASVNLGFQYSTVSTSTTVDTDTTVDNNTTQNAVSRDSKNTNVFGSAVYQHQRLFGLRGLRYSLSFNANVLPSAAYERLAGNPDAPASNVAYYLENHVDYRIGLLDLQLKGAIADTAGKKNALVFFSVTRQFGRY